MNIFNMIEIIEGLPQSTKDIISLFIFVIIPFAVIAISAILRIFCKKSLIITGGVFAFFLLVNLLFFRDVFLTLMAFIYYILSYMGCFVTIICEWILNMLNKARGKVDVDAYGRPKQYSSGALQGKKRKIKNNKKN